MKGLRLIILLLLVLTVFACGVALAGENEWTSIGPDGASISSLVIDPSNPKTLYAGTDVGVLRSTDRGAIWSEVNTGLTTLDVMALAIDPIIPSTLYASTGNGDFKSTDSGMTWTKITDSNVNAVLAIDPVDSDTLYAKTQSDELEWTVAPFRKSTDGGLSWTGIGPVGLGLKPMDLVIDPVETNTLYATAITTSISPWLVGYGYLLKSTDGGVSWLDIKDGLAGAPFHLAIDPLSPSTVYALVDPSSGYAAVNENPKSDYGIFKSTDAGGTWISMNTGLPQISENGEIHNIPLTALAIDPVTPTTLYVATSGQGVFNSVDGAASWAAMSPALTDFTINILAVDPADPTTIYAGTDEVGVFRYDAAASESTTPVASGVGGGGGGGGS